MEHSGRQSALGVGDCILVDSTKPTTFHFGGKFSNHLSLNLPRQLIYFHGGDKLNVAQTLEAADPMAITLRALLAKVLSTADSDVHAANLRQLMLDATRQAFVSDVHNSLSFDSLSDLAARRLQMIDVLIDQHLTSPYLSAQWLAKRVGVSMRVLQLHFRDLGMTCTTFIRDKRLRFAHERIKQLHYQNGAQTIADVAYSAGTRSERSGHPAGQFLDRGDTLAGNRTELHRRVRTEGQVDGDGEIGTGQADIGQFRIGHLAEAIEGASVLPGMEKADHSVEHTRRSSRTAGRLADPCQRPD